MARVPDLHMWAAVLNTCMETNEHAIGELWVEEPQLLAGAGRAVVRPQRVPQAFHFDFHGGEGRKHLLHSLALPLRHPSMFSLVPLHPLIPALLLLKGSPIHHAVAPSPVPQLWEGGCRRRWRALKMAEMVVEAFCYFTVHVLSFC